MLKKIGFILTDAEIHEITEATDLAIEQLLFRLKRHVEDKERVITLKKENYNGKRDNLGNTRDSNEGRKFGPSGSGRPEMNGQQAKLIRDLTDTVAMLEQKLAKMDQLMKAKDEKIRQLSARLGEFN